MGWWGGGWGTQVPQSAKEVAEAFYAGKKKNRSSCRTDGSSYWFVDCNGNTSLIARRVRDDEILEQIGIALVGGPARARLEFNAWGHRTPTTARHFCALGLNADCRGIKNPKFWINDRLMPDGVGWFTPDDIKAWPAEDPDVVAKRKLAEAREEARRWRQGREFVQMTAPLSF